MDISTDTGLSNIKEGDLAMYGSWSEIGVLLRKLLGIIWDPSDVFTVHICSARAQMRSFKSLEGWFWESVLFKLFNDDHEKCNKIFYSKLISCLGTGWENKN